MYVEHFHNLYSNIMLDMHNLSLIQLKNVTLKIIFTYIVLLRLCLNIIYAFVYLHVNIRTGRVDCTNFVDKLYVSIALK